MAETDRAFRALSAVAGFSLLGVLIAGTLVNSHQAALSVPDWPLSYGKLLLRDWPGNTFYEQLHRLFAAVTALLLAAMLAGAWRRRSRRAVGFLCALYLVQVALGGVIVLRFNPPIVSAIHVLTAQLIASGAWLLALGVFPRSAASGTATAGTGERLARIVTTLLFLQVALGAVLRHPPGRAVFGVAILGHLAVALALTILVPYISIRLGRALPPSGAKTASILLGVFYLLQLGVAVPLFLVSPEPFARGPIPPHFPALHAAHVVLAALLLTTGAYVRATLTEVRSRPATPESGRAD